MIDREYGETRLICDDCGDWQKETFDRDEFRRMIDEAKAAGWSVRSGRGEWVHKCPKCAAREELDFEEIDL